MKKLLVLSILFTLVLSPIFFSCEKDEGDKAPELPPLSALEMDFSDFQETKSGSLIPELCSGSSKYFVLELNGYINNHYTCYRIW